MGNAVDKAVRGGGFGFLWPLDYPLLHQFAAALTVERGNGAAPVMLALEFLHPLVGLIGREVDFRLHVVEIGADAVVRVLGAPGVGRASNLHLLGDDVEIEPLGHLVRDDRDAGGKRAEREFARRGARVGSAALRRFIGDEGVLARFYLHTTAFRAPGPHPAFLFGRHFLVHCFRHGCFSCES